LRSPKRVAVIGPGGAGKSTLAVKLADALGLPAVHMDDLLMEPRANGDSPARRREFGEDRQHAIVAEAVTAPRWIIEGGYWRTLDILIDAADQIVFLDPPTGQWLRQVLAREARTLAGWAREDRHWRTLVIHARFLVWLPWYPLRERPRVLRALRGLEPNRVVRLRGQREIDRFITGLKADAETAAG